MLKYSQRYMISDYILACQKILSFHNLNHLKESLFLLATISPFKAYAHPPTPTHTRKHIHTYIPTYNVMLF